MPDTKRMICWVSLYLFARRVDRKSAFTVSTGGFLVFTALLNQRTYLVVIIELTLG